MELSQFGGSGVALDTDNIEHDTRAPSLGDGPCSGDADPFGQSGGALDLEQNFLLDSRLPIPSEVYPPWHV